MSKVTPEFKVKFPVPVMLTVPVLLKIGVEKVVLDVPVLDIVPALFTVPVPPILEVPVFAIMKLAPELLFKVLLILKAGFEPEVQLSVPLLFQTRFRLVAVFPNVAVAPTLVVRVPVPST